MASEESDVGVEDKQDTEETIETDATDVELHSASDTVGDDDDVEAHVWRAQS